MILHPLRQIRDESRTRYVSHDSINYLSHFAVELEKHLDGFGVIREHQLIQHHYLLNFNNMDLLSYLFDEYQKLKEKLEDDQRLMDHLSSHLSQIYHLPKGFKNQVDISQQSIQRKFFEKHPNKRPIE